MHGVRLVAGPNRVGECLPGTPSSPCGMELCDEHHLHHGESPRTQASVNAACFIDFPWSTKKL